MHSYKSADMDANPDCLFQLFRRLILGPSNPDLDIWDAAVHLPFPGG